MQLNDFEKVSCPNCGRTLSHYIKDSGIDSVYRNTCQKCGKTVVIFSAGKTMIVENFSIEIKINF